MCPLKVVYAPGQQVDLFVLVDDIERQLFDLFQEGGLVVAEVDPGCRYAVGSGDVLQVVVRVNILFDLAQGCEPVRAVEHIVRPCRLMVCSLVFSH